MPPPQISIIGAGLSGLVLGRCLLQHGIRSIIYEKDPARSGLARYGYGITLQSSAYAPLLKYLDLDDQEIQRRLAVDSAVSGAGRLSSKESGDAEFRANRQRLEQLLREGLDIRWEHPLTGIKSESSTNILDFRNAHQTKSSVVVSAEGPHSEIRKHISPSTDFRILPYAVYNGKRRLARETFDKEYSPHMKHATVIERRDSQKLMQISINNRTNEMVSISYTYSRPARQSDPIFNPDRPNSGAKDIPQALFDEVAALENLQGPFKDVFDAEKMRQDRLLNWLMRSVMVGRQGLEEAAGKGILLMGDAAHSSPILGGNGANAAIRDGIELADFIAEHGMKGLRKFYEDRYELWRKDVEASERRLSNMHGMGTEAANL